MNFLLVVSLAVEDFLDGEFGRMLLERMENDLEPNPNTPFSMSFASSLLSLKLTLFFSSSLPDLLPSRPSFSMAPPPPPLPATLFSADLPSEDEADDEDFTPPSPTSSTTSSNAPSSKKKRKLSHSPPPTTSEDVVPEAFSYADLVASAEQVEKGGELGEEEKKTREVKMVKITVERKFAGEVVL